MGRHVLMVEDEANIAEAIRFILSRDGWQVSLHPGGEGAMEDIHRLRPDILILDVMLPGRSGFDLLREVRASDMLAQTRILMLTAKGQGQDRAAAEKGGADLFMTKPFSNADILAAVRRLGGA